MNISMLSALPLLQLFSLFLFKHFIVDFPLQGPYQYLNKGKYGHPGGIQHALYHGIATFFVLIIFTDFVLATLLAVFDMTVHYHVDWAKTNICDRMNWKCNTDKYYWWALGVDQFLHGMTYVVIMWLLIYVAN